MPISTNAILRKGTTLEEIKTVLEKYYGQVEVHPDLDCMFSLDFQDDGNRRVLTVFFNDCARNDYKIEGVLVSLNSWGNSIQIMKHLLNEFGGYLDENDSDHKHFYPVNIEAYKQGKDFTPRDLFVNKVIAKVGYDKLKVVMELFDEFKTMQEDGITSIKKEMGKFLSGVIDESEYDEIISKLKYFLVNNPYMIVDNLEYEFEGETVTLEMWEKLANKITIKEFCEYVGITA